MDRLPKEIFIVIISTLPLQDKLNCIAVNNQWGQDIRRSCLYSKLVFKNRSQTLSPDYYYQTAIHFFAVDGDNYNGERAKTVRHLEMYQQSLNVDRIVALPSLFPKLIDIKIIQDRFSNGLAIGQDALIDDAARRQENYVKWWSEVQRIITNETIMIPLINNLLVAPSSPLKNLTCLSLSFGAAYNPLSSVMGSQQDQLRNKMDCLLLSNLQHAPALNKLTLEDIHLDLKDMEILHKSAPNLQRLDLKSIFVSQRETPIIPTNHISNLLKLSVNFFVQPPAAARNGDAYRNFLVCSRTNIIMWLDYFGSKYTNINKLSLTCRGYIDRRVLFQQSDTPLVEQLIIKIISNTNNLTLLHVNMIPLTRNIMEAIDNNDTARLDDIYVGAENRNHDKRLSWATSQNKDPCRDQLLLIQSSRQSKSVKKLTMSYVVGPQSVDDYDTTLPLGCILLDYLPRSRFSENLVCLNLINSISANLFVNVVLYLPWLQSLKATIFDMFGGKVNTKPVATSSGIKKLDMTLVISADISSNPQIMQDTLNNFFHLVVDACPLVENFKSTGGLSCRGGQLYERNCYTGATFKLRFGERHTRLRYLNFGLVGTRYYTFSQMDSKKDHSWANCHRLLDTSSDIEGKNGFIIDLNWCTDGVEVTLDEPSPMR
jgi:hypothetical protein